MQSERTYRIKTKMVGDDVARIEMVQSVYGWLCTSRFIYGSRLRVLSVTQTK